MPGGGNWGHTAVLYKNEVIVYGRHGMKVLNLASLEWTELDLPLGEEKGNWGHTCT